MEGRPYSYLLRTGFFRQVLFYLVGVSFRYRHFFVLPGQPEEPLGFIPEIRLSDGGHFCFDRVGCDALLHSAPSFAFPPTWSSYDGVASEVEWAANHLIRCRCGPPYLWE